MNGDAELLVSLFADDFVSVQDGRITHPTRAESLERFRGYFQRSTLLAWDDLTPPEIHLSPDGRMAVVWVHKLVRTETTAEGGPAVQAETEFAWTETWERRNGAWTLTSVTSYRTAHRNLIPPHDPAVHPRCRTDRSASRCRRAHR